MAGYRMPPGHRIEEKKRVDRGENFLYIIFASGERIYRECIHTGDDKIKFYETILETKELLNNFFRHYLFINRVIIIYLIISGRKFLYIKQQFFSEIVV